jgi:hypothetical protein
MHHEIRKDRISPGNWCVETISLEGGKVIAVATFSGCNARELAEEYAAWKNGFAPNGALPTNAGALDPVA